MKSALQGGKPTSEAREGENCFLLSGFARVPEYAGDVSCIIALTYNEKILKAETSRIEDVRSILPDCWEGQYAAHFVKAEAEFEECYGWTHLAMLEAPDYGVSFGDNVYFGDQKIMHPFIVLAYNQNEKKYHHLHCVDCCNGVADFFMDSQPIWKVRYAKEAGSPKYRQTNFTRH